MGDEELISGKINESGICREQESVM